MKLQLKAVAKMSISWMIIVFTSYSRDNLPIGLQYITIQLVCNKREYKYYVCIYNSHLTSNDTGPDVKASEQQDTMKNVGHRKKSNERQNVICRERLSPIIESGANRRV